MFITHPAYPSRGQLRALAAAEQRDEADLATLESIQAILRSTLAQLRALPRLEHPEPVYCIEDTIRCLDDELITAHGWAELLRNQPTLVEPAEDTREWEWDGENAA